MPGFGRYKCKCCPDPYKVTEVSRGSCTDRRQFGASCTTVRRSAAIGNWARTFFFHSLSPSRELEEATCPFNFFTRQFFNRVHSTIQCCTTALARSPRSTAAAAAAALGHGAELCFLFRWREERYAGVRRTLHLHVRASERASIKASPSGTIHLIDC